MEMEYANGRKGNVSNGKSKPFGFLSSNSPSIKKERSASPKKGSSWFSSAPGLAKRQSEGPVRPGVKGKYEYSGIAKTSPGSEPETGDDLEDEGRTVVLPVGKVLFDDVEVEEEEMDRVAKVQKRTQRHALQGAGVGAPRGLPQIHASTTRAAAASQAVLPSASAQSQSHRVAERLAACSSPLHVTPALINLQTPEPPAESQTDLWLSSSPQPPSLPSSKDHLINDNHSLSAHPPPAQPSIGNDLKITGRAKTSLESIRQQIRQIESELGAGGKAMDHDGGGSRWRPLQASTSSQSINIPAALDSRSPARRPLPSSMRNGAGGMQRAYSVDVAVQSALSDIQTAVRRSSLVKLKNSTLNLAQSQSMSLLEGLESAPFASAPFAWHQQLPLGPLPDIEEPEESAVEEAVWVRRDSSAQTDRLGDMHAVMEEPENGHSDPLMSSDSPLNPSYPDQEVDDESESVYLLGETGPPPGYDRQRPNGQAQNSPRQPSALRRSSTLSSQGAHELIEGILFRCAYLGSTHLFSDSRPTKASRLTQALEAVTRIKAPEGETQPMTEVDLFISVEKMMVLNADIQDCLMEHPLRTISYIADIGDVVVVMVKRGLDDLSVDLGSGSTSPKMLCHVLQSDEASIIAQAIGQAFQVAYMEYLKANGIQDERYLRHLDYLEVLNSQEMSTNELDLLASKDKQTNVVIPKLKGEVLGMVIVESGWGSMLPTVIIANLCPGAPAARCGKLSIGDQLISIDGISLVGLPLNHCQNAIKNVKNHTVVKLTVVSCPPVVEVKIKRPDTRYQLGFSVQNGIICSLLRGGIAERGGIRVGHRIIEINGQSVVATPHEAIVNLLAHSVGHIHLKTMPSSIFRLLTGQDIPVYI